jgi:DNA polymerase-3 subunit epsilon
LAALTRLSRDAGYFSRLCGAETPEDFIAIDFETGTYSPESAVSIGLVKYRDYRLISSYYSLIRPPRLYIRPDFTDIHGIVVKDIKDSPVFKRLWENEISGFIGAAPLVAHNAAFDMGVLHALMSHYSMPIPEIAYFCSLSLSRRVWPELPSHALSALAGTFKITCKAHDALSDADTCARLISLCAAEVSGRLRMKKPLVFAGMMKEAGVEMKRLNGGE